MLARHGPQTGRAKWVFPTGGKVDSSPVVAGKRVYFGSIDGNLYVVELATGAIDSGIGAGNRGGILASPAVGDNRLVIGTVDGGLVLPRQETMIAFTLRGLLA